ncbi:growth factor receptor-bound protein 2-like [Planococcus citri]|uniref:growth factor receptor-bound protein 2-like n=1 Tax=Planococcus citri TaxID=170843 RepID=UPI0031F98D0B
MEAVAKYDFNSDNPGDLSFRRGNVLRVLNMEDDENWFIAELEGKEGVIPSNYIEMKNHDWYFKRVTRQDSEKILRNKPLGSFLVRKSGTPLKDYSISVKCSDKVHHFKIMRDPQGKYFLLFVKFHTLNELVEYYRTASVSELEDVRLRDLNFTDEKVKGYLDFLEDDEIEAFDPSRADMITVTDGTDKN